MSSKRSIVDRTLASSESSIIQRLKKRIQELETTIETQKDRMRELENGVESRERILEITKDWMDECGEDWNNGALADRVMQRDICFECSEFKFLCECEECEEDEEEEDEEEEKNPDALKEEDEEKEEEKKEKEPLAKMVKKIPSPSHGRDLVEEKKPSALEEPPAKRVKTRPSQCYKCKMTIAECECNL